MCDCYSEISTKLKKRIAEQLPPGATGLDVELQGYVFTLGDSVGHKVANNVRAEYMAPKKSGGMKKVVQNMNMIASFCPFCGERYEKETAK